MTNKPNNRQTATLDKNAAFYTEVPLKRGAKPDEIADAIIFLASERASFITGQIVRINGSKPQADSAAGPFISRHSEIDQ